MFCIFNTVENDHQTVVPWSNQVHTDTDDIPDTAAPPAPGNLASLHHQSDVNASANYETTYMSLDTHHYQALNNAQEEFHNDNYYQTFM